MVRGKRADHVKSSAEQESIIALDTYLSVDEVGVGVLIGG